ncbi:MAG TPA: hypothetical protein VGZ02_05500 [Candidatus Baltobacteraceae bacterium]|jgi:DNA-binding beta-propeller fold protein YncE|nr:hypothetical protein [Candidatus Baltobacteraceae bacterium]
MRGFDFGRFTGAVAVTVLLGGCAGGGASVPSVQSFSQARQPAQAGAIDGGNPILFLADLNASVMIYPAQLQQKNPPRLGLITRGVTRSVGVAADSAGNLYVSNFTGASASLSIYRRETRHPLRTITKGLATPGDLAVDTNGTMYVADKNPSDQHVDLLVYPRGATSPARTVVELPLTGYASAAGGVALDTNGSVLEGLVLPEKNQYHVFRITPGSWTVTDLHLQQLRGAAIAADGSGNIYAAESTGGIQFYPSGSLTPTRFLSAPNAEFFGGISALKDGTVYAPSYNGTMFEYAPGALTPTNTFPIQGGGFDAAVASW